MTIENQSPRLGYRGRSVTMDQHHTLQAKRTMKPPILYALLLFAIFAGGCQSEADTSTATSTVVERNTNPSQSLDFDALLTAVDDAIGKRFQSMQMDAMNSASYQYDGPLRPSLTLLTQSQNRLGLLKTMTNLLYGWARRKRKCKRRWEST